MDSETDMLVAEIQGKMWADQLNGGSQWDIEKRLHTLNERISDVSWSAVSFKKHSVLFQILRDLRLSHV